MDGLKSECLDGFRLDEVDGFVGILSARISPDIRAIATVE
jgi:hypothetical protein